MNSINKPVISIITVVYNAKNTINETIKSVISQNYKDIEYIIIDGGSTDGTVDIIKKYDNRIKYWISESDHGIYDAMNKGIKVANGDFIYFLGADDLLFNPNVIANAVRFFKKKNDIYYGNVKFTSRYKLYDGKFNSIKIVTRNISHQSIFYPASVFESYSFNQDYKVFADYALNLVLFNSRIFTFRYIPLTIAIFSDTGLSGLNSSSDLKFQQDFLTLIKANFSIWIYYYRIMRSYLSAFIKYN